MEERELRPVRPREVGGVSGLVSECLLKKPDAALTAAVAQAARARGLILLTCGTYGNVIRLLPPVTMPDELFVAGMGILEQALRDQS